MGGWIFPLAPLVALGGVLWLARNVRTRSGIGFGTDLGRGDRDYPLKVRPLEEEMREEVDAKPPDDPAP